MNNYISLQELITRGRFVFHDSPKKFEVFELLNGKRTIKEISEITKRNENNIHRDIKSLENIGIIEQITIVDGKKQKKPLVVYQKIPLANEIPKKYFFESKPVIHNQPISVLKSSNSKVSAQAIPIPDEVIILDIAKKGESQIYEFKVDGTDITKITKEIAAFLHTKQGGLIFIGIDDDGNIEGCSTRYQDLDQKLQNSTRYAIQPSPTILLEERDALTYKIFIIQISPWDRKTIYQYNEKYYIRKGTNTFALKPEELKKLNHGEPII